MNRFEKYLFYLRDENGTITGINEKALSLSWEAFELFKSLYNTFYGSIQEDGNLISIHTGGWSDNEELISEFEQTGWWQMYHEITATGGHHYFNTDIYSGKNWQITAND